jgi:hypothetical protein
MLGAVHMRLAPHKVARGGADVVLRVVEVGRDVLHPYGDKDGVRIIFTR